MENKTNKNNKNNKSVIIGIIVIVILAAVIIGVSVSSNRGTSNSGSNNNSGNGVIYESIADGQVAVPNETTKRPTFTYFISETDEGYDTILANIETLKSEYGDKVVFDIKKMEDEETKEIAANLPVEGMTPAVFMSTGKMEIKCSDIDKLRACIDEALAAN